MAADERWSRARLRLIGVIAFTGVLIQGWMLRKRDYRTLGVPSQPLAYVLGGWRPVAETACWAIIVLVQLDRQLEEAARMAGAGPILGDVNHVHPFREGNGRTQLQYLKWPDGANGT